MTVSIENDLLQISIALKGAELKSVVNKHTGLEYMWNGDPAFWAKTSPILFPIVGTLKNDTYFFKGKSYSLPRHGFARDSVFEILRRSHDEVMFSLVSTPTLHEKYPFDFELRVKYRVVKDTMEVTYEISNNGGEAMYFSVGGHPAFKVPLVKETTYEDYYLEFDRKESASRWPITSEGLIKKESTAFLNNTSRMQLSHTLFSEDALVFKNLQSSKVSIRSDANKHGLDFSFEGFPYLGIWAAKNADFVCIEPWCGIADSELHDQQLISKEGIVSIGKNESWARTWKVKFY